MLLNIRFLKLKISEMKLEVGFVLSGLFRTNPIFSNADKFIKSSGMFNLANHSVLVFW